MTYPTEVKKAIDALEDNGYEAYVVGGCLRNILMGKKPNDWDMTTSALPEETLEIFRDKGYHVIETGLKHGTVTVIIDHVPLEITTFRIDGEYNDFRHPSSVTFTRSLHEDLARRDFTVNAMAYSVGRGLTDLYGGEDDLKRKLLRAVGEPAKRFTEDALRILRAFRFSAEHGFVIEEETKKGIIKCRAGLRSISRERICSELYRMLLGDNASSALGELLHCGLMSFIFEGYDESFSPNAEFLDHLPKRIAPRLACFFMNFSYDEAKKALFSLKMSNKDKADTNNVLSALEYLKCSSPESETSARRFIRSFGDNGIDALTLASLSGADTKKAEEAVQKALETDFPRTVAELAIGGREVIELGASGKATGVILSFLLEKTADDPTLNNAGDLCELAKKYILENKNEHNDN